MAISTADFKNGKCISIDGKPYLIIDFQHVKPGKGGAFVRTKVRDVKFAVKDDELLITVDADDEITLEKGFFGRKASMFEEVFGIRPVLRQKKITI